MAKPKQSSRSVRELELEVEFLRANQGATNRTKIIQDAIKYGFIALCFYFCYLAIDSLAGKTTWASVDLRAAGELSVNQPEEAVCPEPVAPWYSHAAVFVALLVGFAGWGYGKAQERLRKEVIARMHPYQELWEKSAHPGRTSSQLTRSGDTRPEDL